MKLVPLRVWLFISERINDAFRRQAIKRGRHGSGECTSSRLRHTSGEEFRSRSSSYRYALFYMPSDLLSNASAISHSLYNI